MNDGDIKTTTKTWKQKEKIEDLQGGLTYAGHVFSPSWVRRTVQDANGPNWLILESRHRLLLYFRLFLVIVYIIVETFK